MAMAIALLLIKGVWDVNQVPEFYIPEVKRYLREFDAEEIANKF